MALFALNFFGIVIMAAFLSVGHSLLYLVALLTDTEVRVKKSPCPPKWAAAQERVSYDSLL